MDNQLLIMEISIITLSVIIGVIGGFVGIMYRNCLVVDFAIFSKFYDILKNWKDNGRRLDSTKWQKFLSWISQPLATCIYCSSTWITIILYLLITELDIYIIFSIAVQHIVVVSACKFLISGNKDLEYKRELRELKEAEEIKQAIRSNMEFINHSHGGYEMKDIVMSAEDVKQIKEKLREEEEVLFIELANYKFKNHVELGNQLNKDFNYSKLKTEDQIRLLKQQLNK